MLLSTEDWMDLRAYRALRDAGATWAEIARETGHDWRTHWDGLPHAPQAALPPCETVAADELEPVWARIPKTAAPVGRRDLSTYDEVGRVA